MSNPSDWPPGEVRELDVRMITGPACVVMARLLIRPSQAVLYHCRVCGAERRSPHSDPGYLQTLYPLPDCSLSGNRCESQPVQRAQADQHYYVPGSLVWYFDSLSRRYLLAIVEPCPDGRRTHIYSSEGTNSPDETFYFITLIDWELEVYRGGFVQGSQLTPCFVTVPGREETRLLNDDDDILRWDLPQRLLNYSFVAVHGLSMHEGAIRDAMSARQELLPPPPEQVLQRAQDIAKEAMSRLTVQEAPAKRPLSPRAEQLGDAPAQAPIWHPLRVEILSPNVVTQAGIERFKRRTEEPRTVLYFDCALCGARRNAPFDDPGFFQERPRMTCADAPGAPSCVTPPRPRPTTCEYHFVPGTLVWYLDRRKARWAAMVEDPPDGSMSYMKQEGLPHHRTSYYITLIGPEGMFAGGFAMSRQLSHLSRPLTQGMTRPAYEEPTKIALRNLCVDLRTRLQTFSVVVQVQRWRAQIALAAPGLGAATADPSVAGSSGLNVAAAEDPTEEGGDDSPQSNSPPKKKSRGGAGGGN